MDKLRAAFETPHPLTVGVEEELMLLDAETLDLAPRAPEVLAALGGDPRFKLEMPAAHIEIVLPPLGSAAEVAAALLAARRDLARACSSLGLRPAGAGVHPFAAPLGELNSAPRYDSMLAEFGDVARSQLVCALQVHVAVRPAERAMAVYNALRPFLPLLGALAANGPIHEGRDTGLASARPPICELLPQQGLPPELTWESYAERMTDPARWWWELRPHPVHGTLEVRVPDTQATVEEAAAVVAVVHALVATLAEGESPRAPASPGETPSGDLVDRPPADLEADRRAAYAHGASGPFVPRLHAVLDAIAPAAERLGTSAQLAS
ncbi:MAG: YbdK family carboxylate-amine ligase, partial [Actinomycetota bacterium]|nr:YbdK family carboxylate-amine ligase [Actinomycetota bacterium]